MNDYTFPEALWAGTEQSLAIARENHNRMMAGPLDEGDEPEVPYTFSKQGEIGIVTVRGSLVNRDSWLNQYIGQTSYSEIGRAMAYAAMDDSVKAILLDIDSGGGAVAGCADCGDLITAIDAIKPVYGFTGGIMASAAYWLGTSARDVSASQTAVTGSIGVLTVHMSMARMLEQEGVDVTVMREGKYKALANPYEKLSQLAKDQIEARQKSAYGIFIGHVADRRGVTVDHADTVMGQGREFFGIEAVGAGLVDRIETFDSIMGRIQAGLLDTASRNPQNVTYSQRGLQMTTPRPAMTAQQIAALAAGVGVQQDAAASGGAVAEAAKPPAATPEQSTTPAQPAEAGVVAASKAVAAPAAPAAPAVQAQPDVLAFFQGQVMTLSSEVGTLKASGTADKARIAELEANQAQLVQIAGRSLSHMKVALGGTAIAIEAAAMPVTALLADHKATSDKFTDAFKVGGVAAVGQADAAATQTLSNDPLRAARVAAATLRTK